MYPGERFNTCTHLVGLVLAVLGVPVMLARTLPGGDATKIAGALIFTLCCVMVYGASTMFHGTRGLAKLRWQRMDHGAIYLLIAGTYTPFALVTLRGALGWLLLAAAWGVAWFGIWHEYRSKTARAPLVVYLAMGWAAVAAAVPLVARLDATGLLWLLAGAVSYTVGTTFYVNRAGYRHAHGIWHLFVLCGTASHYAAIAGVVV